VYPSARAKLAERWRARKADTHHAASKSSWDRTSLRMMSSSPDGTPPADPAIRESAFPQLAPKGSFSNVEWPRVASCCVWRTLRSRLHPCSDDQFLVLRETTCKCRIHPFMPWTLPVTIRARSHHVLFSTSPEHYSAGPEARAGFCNNDARTTTLIKFRKGSSSAVKEHLLGRAPESVFNDLLTRVHGGTHFPLTPPRLSPMISLR
jgi:hypothetical protein